MSSLNSAARILQLLASRERNLTVTDVVEGLGMPKSSSSRLLKQMMDCGLLERDKRTLAYGPSLLMLELAHQVRAATPLLERMERAVQELAQETGHTGYISALDESGKHVVVLRVHHGAHPLRVVTSPGHRLPAFATSTGRALLARLDDEAIRARFSDDFDCASEGAPKTVSALIQQLERVRDRGWALALNEALPGVGSLSCAVSDPQAGQTLSFCLSFPVSLAQPELIDTLARRLVGHASSIGRAAGDSFWNAQS
ncbi:IclR family transcriptional regulator [Paralcaligenes ginsengisoli]